MLEVYTISQNEQQQKVYSFGQLLRRLREDYGARSIRWDGQKWHYVGNKTGTVTLNTIARMGDDS